MDDCGITGDSFDTDFLGFEDFDDFDDIIMPDPSPEITWDEVPDDVAAAIRSVPDGGSSSWDSSVTGLMVLAYDTDDSGSINTRPELAHVPCDVWTALDDKVRENWSSGIRVVYGFDGGSWLGNLVGIDEGLRAAGQPYFLDATVLVEDRQPQVQARVAGPGVVHERQVDPSGEAEADQQAGVAGGQGLADAEDVANAEPELPVPQDAGGGQDARPAGPRPPAHRPGIVADGAEGIGRHCLLVRAGQHPHAQPGQLAVGGGAVIGPRAHRPGVEGLGGVGPAEREQDLAAGMAGDEGGDVVHDAVDGHPAAVPLGVGLQGLRLDHPV